MKKNNLFVFIFVFVFVLIIGLGTGCAALPQVITKTPVVLRDASTNFVIVPVYQTNTVFRTNFINSITADGTPITTAQVVTQFQTLTNFLTNTVVQSQIVYTNESVNPVVTGAIQGGANLIPIPGVGAITGAVLALVSGFFTVRNKSRHDAAIAALNDTHQTAIDKLTSIGQATIQSLETVRQAALAIPQYAAIDAKVMNQVKDIQSKLGVSSEIADLVDTHTSGTKPVA